MEDRELDELMDPPLEDILVVFWVLILPLSPSGAEIITGAVRVESAPSSPIAYALEASRESADFCVKIFEETENVTSPDRLEPSRI